MRILKELAQQKIVLNVLDFSLLLTGTRLASGTQGDVLYGVARITDPGDGVRIILILGKGSFTYYITLKSHYFDLPPHPI